MRLLMTILTGVSLIIFLPVHPLEVSGNKTAGSDPSSMRQQGTRRGQKSPESFRVSFRHGMEALEQGDTLKAGLLLQGLEEDYPVLSDYILYGRIRSALGTGDASLALSLAGRFLNDYPESILTSRVRMERVRAHLSLKEFPAARAEAEDLLYQEEDPERTRQVSWMLGASYEGEGNGKAALGVYQRLAYEAPATPEGEEAEQRMRRLIEAAGMRPEPPDEELYLASVRALDQALKFDRVIEVSSAFQRDYPRGPGLEEALLLKAKALMKRGRAKEGQELYERLAQSGGTAAVRGEAAYQIGSYLWNRHENSRAMRTFKRLIRKQSGSEWGLKAHYALGRIYEEEAELSHARKAYLKIGKIAPRHPLAAEGAWRAGWVEYKAGRYKEADRFFALCMEKYRDSDVFADALYWKGRCEEARGEVVEAKKAFLRLVQDFGWDFYGVMARDRLRSQGDLIPEPSDPGVTGGPAGDLHALGSDAVPAFSYHLARAEELIRIGFFAEAGEEVRALQSVRPKTPGVSCLIANLYEKSRNFYDSVRWISVAGGSACGLKPGTDSASYMRYLYPLAFWETVRKESEKFGLDPFLVLAVMRQESLFQADVVSSADARGLMQIIPSTAETIARELAMQGFTPDSLFHSETNITFGSWYLSSLMKRSEGDLVRLLSSYNAGESQSDRWWDQNKHLALDERIESITYRETKGYVKKVLRNLENYKRLYQDLSPDIRMGATAPSLPGD